MSEQENIDARASYDAYNNQSSIKEFWATPLKIRTVGGGRTEVYVHLSNTTMAFQLPEGQTAIERVGDKVKYGWLDLSIDNELTNITQQDKLWMAHVRIRVNNPTNLRILKRESCHAYIELHPSLEAYNIKEENNTVILPDTSTAVFRKVMQQRIKRHRFLCERTPTQEVCIPSKPRSGKLKQWYLQGIEESPQRHRVKSLQDELDLLRRSVVRIGSPSHKVETYKEGKKKWGMVEQKKGSVISVVDDEGNEVKKMSKIFSKDNIKIEEHKKLDFTKVKYKGKRFNALLRQLPSTSITPIRQWVDAVGEVEEWSIGVIGSLFSIINIFDDLNLPKGK
jgi:hypothetical protein